MSPLPDTGIALLEINLAGGPPYVLAGAVALAVIPSIVTGDWEVWVHRALIFLVISCPCALVISIPLSFFGGIGGASARASW